MCGIWHDWVSSVPIARNSYYVLIAFSAWTDNSEQGSLVKRRVGFLRSDSATVKICRIQCQSRPKFVCLVHRLLCQEDITMVHLKLWIVESLSLDLTHWDSDFPPQSIQCKFSEQTQISSASKCVGFKFCMNMHILMISIYNGHCSMMSSTETLFFYWASVLVLLFTLSSVKALMITSLLGIP